MAHPTPRPPRLIPARHPTQGPQRHTPKLLCGSTCFMLKYTWADPTRFGSGEKERMTVADPRARRRQHLVCAPVHRPTPAGRSGLNIWRSSTEWGRGGSQSWAQESSAEGLHQLHGSIVLERGREEAGTGDDSCWGKGAEKGLSHLPGPRTHHPRPHSTLHAAPSQPRRHTALSWGAMAPELLSSPPSIRTHSQLPLCQEDSALARPGPAPSIRQVARRHGWDSPHPPPNSPHTGTPGSLAPMLLPQKQRKR